MKIEKIKIKDWIENHRHGSVAIGQKIIISTYDKQPLSLLELESIKEFIKKLMKSRALFISLIGMMSMTAFATTSEPEQKQNPVFTDPPIELVYTANVENHNVDIFMISPLTPSLTTHVLLKSNILYEFVAIITDVGWQSRKLVYSNIPHKEKLQTDYVIDKKQILSYLGLINKRFSC